MRYLPQEGVLYAELEDYKKPALVKGQRVISYADLREAISSFASLVDVLPGECVLIISENRPEWVYALYGSWQRGGVVVPVDHLAQAQEVVHILKETQPQVAFCSDTTQQTLSKALESLGLETRVYNFDRLNMPLPHEKPISRELDDTALILYTSGTTGEPKGVMLSFRNLLSNIEAIKKVGVAGKEDKTLALLPFHHSYPLMVTLLVPLSIGATVVFLEKLSSEEVLKALREHGITILVGVPRLYQVLALRIEENIRKNPLARALYTLAPSLPKGARRVLFRRVHRAFGGRLRYMVSGGAKLNLDTAYVFERLGFTLLEGYGLTETSPIVSFNPPNKVKLGSVGLPIEGVKVRISEEGEVLVKGPNVMQGYYKKPEETAKVLKDGWLYTGDLGYLDEEGYLYITGRKKELIVLAGGKNVFPEELEALIVAQSPVVKECAVLEVEGSLKAIVVPDMQKVKELGILNLREYLTWWVVDKVNQKLPEWKRITGFKVYTEELPKTRLGKIKRYLLADIYAKAEKLEEEREEDPLVNTPEGQLLIGFLKEFTQGDVRGYHHIELDLGLDSLAKVELLAFIEKSFGVSLTEEDLVQNPTVQEILRLILEQKAKAQSVQISWKDILKDAEPYSLQEYKLPFLAGRFLLKTFFKLYNRLEVKGLENLPEPPFILAPNHASYLDGFVLASALPPSVATKTYFLGAEEYFENPVGALFGRLAHVITVNLDRRLKESLQKTAWALRLGKVVVIFPEGARTRDGNLLPFKKGFAILSKELEVPVVPVALLGTYQSLSIRDRFPKPSKIRVVFGKPIKPEGKSYEEIVEETRKAIEELKIYNDETGP